jgi:DNA topoisomerase-2
MLMMDQDNDGAHIAGLFINFIHQFWPELLEIPGFMTQFITPILKVGEEREGQEGEEEGEVG